MSETGSHTSRSHALIVIALCFLASAALRGESVALAAADALDAAQDEPAAEHVEADGHAGQDEAMEGCSAAPVIAMLKEREAEFEKREAALNARAAKLDAVASRLDERIATLKATRDELAQTVARVDGAQRRDIDHLVTMYSTMKPKRAGELFNQMDVKFASELLVRTKPEIAALILANMDADKAFTASLMIARRNANAPTK